MKSLNEDLKTGQFKQIYLLYGEEAYLKKLYKNRFVKAMVPEGDTMNYRYFEGKNTNPKEIIDLAETLPFFAERRLIVLENTGFLKNATPELAEYLKNMPETTYMIFVESELDKRGKLYKAIKEKGHIVELKRQDEKTLARWVLGMLKREEKQNSWKADEKDSLALYQMEGAKTCFDWILPALMRDWKKAEKWIQAVSYTHLTLPTT